MSCAMSLVSYTLSADLSDILGLVQKCLLVAIWYCNVIFLVCEWGLEFGPFSDTSFHIDYSLLVMQEGSYQFLITKCIQKALVNCQRIKLFVIWQSYGP